MPRAGSRARLSASTARKIVTAPASPRRGRPCAPGPRRGHQAGRAPHRQQRVSAARRHPGRRRHAPRSPASSRRPPSSGRWPPSSYPDTRLSPGGPAEQWQRSRTVTAIRLPPDQRHTGAASRADRLVSPRIAQKGPSRVGRIAGDAIGADRRSSRSMSDAQGAGLRLPDRLLPVPSSLPHLPPTGPRAPVP
jgi:hypothetical protein